MHVLIVRLGAFGDIVHTLPLAADLHDAGHRVAWLCEDRWAALLQGSPVVDELQLFPRKIARGAGGRLAALKAVKGCLRRVRGATYDAVIDAQGLAKSAVMAAASGAPIRIGHARPRAREGSWLLMRHQVEVDAVHVIDQQRGLARALGIAPRGPWRFPLPLWTHERRWAREWLAAAGSPRPWLLNVGAGWPTKVWPEHRQIEFARLARERGQALLIAWGNPGERAAAERIHAAAGHGVLAPETTIPQLAGLIAGSVGVVSGDTGPLHLAQALGTPAVGLFGPVPAERNGPRGPGYRTIQAPGAAWERRDVTKVDMAAIGAARVASELDAAIGDRIRVG